MAAKGVFAAQIKYIVDMWNLEYAKASMANTFYFVAYGLVQVGLFFLIKKISMRRYLLVAVPVAAISTALIGVATKIEHIWIYFGISGAFQAGIYCGCNLLLTRYLPLKLLSTANTIMNLGYASGTLVAYGMSALFIGFNAWFMPYFIIGGIFMASIFTFGIIVLISRRFAKINGILDKKLIDDSKNKQEKNIDDRDPLIKVHTKKDTIIFYAVDLVMAFLITSLYYCVMNYISSLLVDVHGMSQDVSIYISMIAPVTIALGPMLVIRSCDKYKDFIRQALLFSLVLVPIPILLAFFYDSNVIVALSLTIVFIVISNGVKAIILSVMTFKLRYEINAGAYSAISNAVASVSAGVTPTVIGSIIDNAGWSAAYWTTFAIVMVVVACIFVIDVFVRRSYYKRHNVENPYKKKKTV